MKYHIKPKESCPFCGSTKLEVSMKRREHFSRVNYQLSFYCKNCHCYGPRLLYNTSEDKSRYDVCKEVLEQNLLQEAATLWDTRGESSIRLSEHT